MKSTISTAARLVAAAALTLSVFVVTAGRASAAPPDGTYVSLPLINGWSIYPGARAPKIDRSNGVVHLRGMITSSSSSDHPFVVPQHFRPNRTLFLPVAMCAGAYGRIDIQANGVVTILTPFAWNRATCLTSLEGVSYVQTTSASSSVPITPINGWSAVDQSRFLTYSATANLVHLTGQLHTSGNNHAAFVVPLAPANVVVVPIGLCNGEVGDLAIDTSGTATVVTAVSFGYAKCLISLDGVSYWANTNAPSFVGIVPHNGWHSPVQSSSHTRSALTQSHDAVALDGAMGSERAAPTAPYTASGPGVPSGRVQLLAATCGGYVGQLEVFANAATRVWVPNGGGWAAAKCMTSLNGIQYAAESLR